jgi:hypothetical protein
MTPSEAQKIILALAEGVDPKTGQIVTGATPLDRPDVVRALYLAARALDANVQQVSAPEPVAGVGKFGAAWTREEDERLLRAFDGGTLGAIRSRLAKHGRVSVATSETASRQPDPRSVRLLEFNGIKLNVDWTPDNALKVERLPTCAGVYAEIHWPKHGVRIGETGVSIRGKILHDIRWFQGMHDGTEAPEQLRRTIPIALAAKEHGASGFAFYVVSDDPRLLDKKLRQECERHLFAWLNDHPGYQSWNHQKSWR